MFQFCLTFLKLNFISRFNMMEIVNIDAENQIYNINRYHKYNALMIFN